MKRQIILVVVLVVASIAAAWAYVEKPWLSPCEQFDRRCAAGRAAGDINLAMLCELYYIQAHKVSQEECRGHVEAIDQYRRGRS